MLGGDGRAPTEGTTMNKAQAYESAHKRVLSILDPQKAKVEVPTCPGWTVKDLVAHLASFFAVAKSGDPQEAFSQGWGDREVKERHDRSLQECIDEWASHLEDAGDLFESQLGMVAVADVLAHEQDIRTALDKRGGRDDKNIVPAVEMGLSFVDKKARDGNLPALRIVTNEIDRQVGEGEVAATLRTSTFELFRALHGRRTVDQVRAMEWDGDPAPWMSVFFVFGPSEKVVEAA
jgi:uncharacterized protein (TIGR03083 family)